MSRRGVGLLLEVATPVAVVAAWWFWSDAADSFFFPPLRSILHSFNDTWIFERFGSDVLPSLKRMFIGYALAAVIAVSLGMLLGLSDVASRAADPIIAFLRAIPPTALVPFGIVVLGVGDVMKIFIITLVCIFPILISTVDGVRSCDPILAETSRSYAVDGFARLRRVTLPAAMPQIFAGLRTALSIALILMVVTELVAGDNGIGFFVLEAERQFSIAQMWSGILLLGVLGYTLNGLFLLLERRALRWYHGVKDAADV